MHPHSEPTEIQRAARRARLALGPLALLAAVPHPSVAQPGAPTHRVVADAIEVNQTVQLLAPAAPLIERKATWIRAYLKLEAGSPVAVSGTLLLEHLDTGARRPVPSSNALALDPKLAAPLSERRRSLARSLNFFIPTGELAPGRYRFILQDLRADVGGVTVPCVGCADGQVALVEPGAPLRLQVIGFRNDASTPRRRYVPRELDLRLLRSWLERTLPVSEVRMSYREVSVPLPPGFDCLDANAELSRIRSEDVRNGADGRTHYYAMVPNDEWYLRGCAEVALTDGPTPWLVASGPTGPTSGAGLRPVNSDWDQDGSFGDWYALHELAHTMGRRHVESVTPTGTACGQEPGEFDSDYRPTGGRLTDVPDAIGLDPGDPERGLSPSAFAGSERYDIMTYCGPVWLSAYTFRHLRDRLLAEERLGPGGAAPVLIADAGLRTAAPAQGAGPASRPSPAEGVPAGAIQPPTTAMRVIATVSLTRGTGRIIELSQEEKLDALPDSAGDQRVRLVLKDADGKVVTSRALPLRLPSHQPDTNDARATINAVVPYPFGVASVSLQVDGKDVDTRRLSSRSPSLSRPTLVHSGPPIPGVAEPIVIEWNASDSDTPSDRITYKVLVRYDEDQSWQTVAVGYTRRQFRLLPADYRGHTRVAFKVIATDGFNEAVLATGEMKLP